MARKKKKTNKRIPRYMKAGYTRAKKAELKTKYRKQTAHATIASKAKRLYKKATDATEKGFSPLSVFDFMEVYEKENRKQTKNYDRLQTAMEYLEEDTLWKEWKSGTAGTATEEARQALGKEMPLFWRVVQMLEDMGLGSFDAISAEQQYVDDTGGKPLSVTLSEFAEACFTYYRYRVDIYEEAVTQTPWRLEDAEDINNIWNE